MSASSVPARFSRPLLGFALLGLAHWFFGNLYEAIVLAPNMLRATLLQLQAWQNYFTVTNQIYYYVPFTQLAVGAVVVSWYRSARGTSARRWLRWAALLSGAALLLTGYIVTQLNLSLFFGDLQAIRPELESMALRWNGCNLLRVGLLGGALYNAYRAHMSWAELS